MKFAFADPPYIGQAQKHYGRPEVDHGALVQRLVTEYPDGWALCLSSPTIFQVGDLIRQAAHDHACRIAGTRSVEIGVAAADAYLADCRIGAWVKPFASFKPGVNPAYAWEPVIWYGGRRPADRAMRVRNEREQYIPTVRDWVSASITLKKGLAGAKPARFCDWVFDLLGATDGDELDDLFPGTGVVTARWKARQGKLALV